MIRALLSIAPRSSGSRPMTTNVDAKGTAEYRQDVVSDTSINSNPGLVTAEKAERTGPSRSLKPKMNYAKRSSHTTGGEAGNGDWRRDHR